MDEAVSSGTRYDSHVFGLDLSDVGATPYAGGVKGNALAPDQVSDGLERSDHQLLSVNYSWSVAGWFYCGNRTHNPRIVRKTTGTAPEYHLYHQTVNPWRMAFLLYHSGGSSEVIPGGYSLVDSNWYFFYAWLAGSSNVMGLRINDSLEALADIDPYTATDSDSPLEVMKNATVDRVDELGMWQRVLTGSEVTALYNGGAGITYSEIPKGGNRFFIMMSEAWDKFKIRQRPSGIYLPERVTI